MPSPERRPKEVRYIEPMDYAQIAKSFSSQLRQASQGQETSISYIRNPLTQRSLVPPGATFQAFVIGGTNGKVVTAQMGEENISTINRSTDILLPKFVTKEDLFQFIEANLDPNASAIGINFAYKLIPTIGDNGQLDGILESADTKGIALKDLKNQQVGKTIQDYFAGKGRVITVAVGNDTVCMLSSALDGISQRDTLVGGIVGTGYNLTLMEGDTTIVNLQAAGFTGFTPSISGRLVDQQSTNVGEQLYEKEVAAGDLWKHYNAYLSIYGLGLPHIDSTEQLSELALHGVGPAKQLATELFERSASLVAAHIAGIYEFKNSPKHLTFVMEGSLFWKGPDYMKNIRKRLTELGVQQDAIQFIEVENSSVKGAIKLVTG